MSRWASLAVKVSGRRRGCLWQAVAPFRDGRYDAIDRRGVLLAADANRVALERGGELRQPDEAERAGIALERMRLATDQSAVELAGDLLQQRDPSSRLGAEHVHQLAHRVAAEL